MSMQDQCDLSFTHFVYICHTPMTNISAIITM
jgi:hypothetical protein